MSQWNTAAEILEFAIKGEEQSAEFYRHLAKRVDNPGLKKTFEEYAKEEEGHKAKLESVKTSGTYESSIQQVQDLKIADYLVEVDPDQVKDYQEALILGMKREKAAFKLYSDLANRVEEPQLKSLLLSLAQEEAKHKLRFEVEYDDNILTEN